MRRCSETALRGGATLIDRAVDDGNIVARLHGRPLPDAALQCAVRAAVTP